jgi:hypothetical protein
MGMEKLPLFSFFSGLSQPQKYVRFPICFAISARFAWFGSLNLLIELLAFKSFALFADHFLTSVRELTFRVRSINFA